MRLYLRRLCIVFALLGASGANAQSPPTVDPISHFSTRLLPGTTLSGFLEQRRLEFRQADVDGDGVISPADLARQSEVGAARLRSNRLALILRADLDGDGVITREELEQFAATQSNWSSAVQDVMRFDRNQDGRLDWSELVAFAQSDPNALARATPSPAYQAIMALDADHDGKTTWEEYRTAAERFFQSVDTNHDGVVSREEIEANRARTGFGPPPELLDRLIQVSPGAQAFPAAPSCDLPAAPQGAKIVLVRGYGAQGLSSVAVGSPSKETRAAAVTIEPGDEPLYLVLVAEGPMIWQFDGAVGRVVKAVLVSLNPIGGGIVQFRDTGSPADIPAKTVAPFPFGATGLAAHVVAFARDNECGRLASGILGQGGSAAQAEVRSKDDLAAFKRLVGREPDLVRSIDKLWKLKLPSGQAESAERSSDTIDPSLSALVFKRRGKGDFTYYLDPGSRVVIGPADAGPSIRIETPAPTPVDELREEFMRDYPGGVVRIDPAAVVAAAPVAPYEVLPKHAGMIQLLESGAIARNGQGEYLVKRKIQIPPGVSAKFLVLKGVPFPDGDASDASDATIVSEDTGEISCPRGGCRPPLAGGPRPAPSAPRVRGPAELLFELAITPDLTLSRYLDLRRADFRGLDLDRDGVLTAADRERFLKQAAASMRAIAVQQIIEADLDGDGVVTRDEVIKFVTARSPAVPAPGGEAGHRARIDHAVEQRMKLDLDHNGVIDAAEIFASARQRAAAIPRYPTDSIDAALALGTDGKTTLADFESAAERVFHAVDTNGDGIISNEEFQTYRRGMALRPIASTPGAPPPPECTMPPAPAGAKVVLVGTDGGAGDPTVALGSQDVGTGTARVTIEDGAEPLYLVMLASPPMIWQFDGAVERVVRALLSSNHRAYPKPLQGIAAGASGLAREVVTFAARPDCIRSFVEIPSIASTLAAAAIKREVGREPDSVIGLHSTGHVWLPSGRHETSGVERRNVKTMEISRSSAPMSAAQIRDEFEQSAPAGVVRIDPATVVAGQPVEPYAVLPGRAGLLQLIEEGKLEPGRGQELVVRAKIRFPADLGNMYKFRIPKGVPGPDGDPGQSCVVYEDGPPPRPGCD